MNHCHALVTALCNPTQRESSLVFFSLSHPPDFVALCKDVHAQVCSTKKSTDDIGFIVHTEYELVSSAYARINTIESYK